jgi:hypothetical protein
VLSLALDIDISQYDVVALVGSPDEKPSLKEWQYDVMFGYGWIEIWFDDDGNLMRINDESPLP